MDQQPGLACQWRFCVLTAASLKRQKGEAAVKYITLPYASLLMTNFQVRVGRTADAPRLEISIKRSEE